MPSPLGFETEEDRSQRQRRARALESGLDSIVRTIIGDYCESMNLGPLE
jgi:hypothetical protein